MFGIFHIKMLNFLKLLLRLLYYSYVNLLWIIVLNELLKFRLFISIGLVLTIFFFIISYQFINMPNSITFSPSNAMLCVCIIFSSHLCFFRQSSDLCACFRKWVSTDAKRPVSSCEFSSGLRFSRVWLIFLIWLTRILRKLLWKIS